MITSRHNLALLGLGGLALIATSACSVDLDLETKGSGTAETVGFTFESFDKVDLSSGFEAEITVVEGSPSVEVTVDDNLIDKLDVKVDDGALNVGFKRGRVSTEVTPTVVVSMPSLIELDLSGGSEANVEGVDGSTLSVDVSGGGDADIVGITQELTIDLSGGSTLAMTGSADSVALDLSGAAEADLSLFEANTADVDLSGGSEATFKLLASVTGDMSGGSSLTVPDGTSISIDTSGGSDIIRG